MHLQMCVQQRLIFEPKRIKALKLKTLMENDAKGFSLTCDGTASIQKGVHRCAESDDLLGRIYP